MRIGEILYFAPGIKFSEVDLDGPALPDQFRRRVVGFYLDPACDCVKRCQAFAAGMLLVGCVDALARLRFGNRVGDRFKRFARDELRSFSAGTLATRFYKHFRNGLVHEARLKEGAQFSLETGQTVEELEGLLLVNPRYLADEVRAALDSYVALVTKRESERRKLADALKRDHAKDLSAAGAHGATEQPHARDGRRLGRHGAARPG